MAHAAQCAALEVRGKKKERDSAPLDRERKERIHYK